MTLVPFHEIISDDLTDPEFVAVYLEECLKADMATFRVGLREVVRANGGMSQLAEKTGLSRESLYRTLSEQGNPEFRTIQVILAALGLRIAFAQTEELAAAA
jgi:probable addiction module antidote protein